MALCAAEIASAVCERRWSFLVVGGGRGGGLLSRLGLYPAETRIGNASRFFSLSKNIYASIESERKKTPLLYGVPLSSSPLRFEITGV